MGTYDQYELTDASTNASTYHWDFGDDSTSTLQNPILWYPRSGTYILSLSIVDGNGHKSTATRQVKVLDRVIKQVSIDGLTDHFQQVRHSLDHSSIWAVIKLGGNNATYPFPTDLNQSFNAPIIYQSPVVANADSLQLPFTFNVPGKMIVDFPALTTNWENGLGYQGVGYGLELYARDSTGTYLLSTSYAFFYFSGSGGITWPVADVQKNVFIMQYGNVSVTCDNE